MSRQIYKYVGASYLSSVFELRNYVTLKCSYPKDFDDPYELFLTINFDEKPGALAFYKELIGELPQIPVTCFSSEPHVLPMWAHYAEKLSGVVIALNQEGLEATFPGSRVEAIDYRRGPDPDLTDTLYRAYEIGKMRYLYLLRRGVFSSAYYSKAKCWSYEKELRLLLKKQFLRSVADSSMFVDVPRDCINSIICGPRAKPSTISATQEKAQQIRTNWYQMQIGRTAADPYFVDASGSVYIHRKSGLKLTRLVCGLCREPVARGKDVCSWCQIEKAHEVDAAERNSFRMLAHYGMLDEYISGMDDITSGSRRK